jgi:VWFA-related protein
MTSWTNAKPALLAAGLAAGLASIPSPVGRAQSQEQLPTFRSSANAVMVDVNVRDKNRKVIANLKADDFEVLDNGVAQTVDNVSYGKLPIDVTVALDVSYSVTGTLLDRLRRGVTTLMNDLKKEDRLKLMLFNNRVNRTVDLTGDTEAVDKALKAAAAGGSTALLDAISVALVSGSAPDRRQLVMFFTDGSDSSSVSTPSAVTTTARRARATLSFVMPSLANVTVNTAGRGSTSSMGLQFASGLLTRTDPVYTALAKETGGSVFPVSASTDLAAIFRQVLGDFRSAYVLYFNAKGVEQGGYHTLEVKVKRGDTTVQARRGYWY